MEIEQQVSPVADFQAPIRVHASVVKTFQLFHQSRYVNNGSVANDIDFALVQHTAGQQMEGEFFVTNNERVSCICTPVEARDNIIRISQDVYQLSFALISPLCAQDGTQVRFVS